MDNLIHSKFSKFSDVLNSLEVNDLSIPELDILENFDWLASVSIYENTDTFAPRIENWKESSLVTSKLFPSIENDVATLTLRAASANLQNRVFYGNLNTQIDNMFFVITKQKPNGKLIQILGWIDLRILLNELKQVLPKIYSIRVVDTIRSQDNSENVAWS